MAETANTEVTTENVGTQIDYEAEYKKVVAERDTYKAEADKQKRMKDQYATENAEYKKKEAAQMSDEDRKAKELQEILDGKAQLEAEVAQLKLERECAAKGFTAQETDKLISGKFAVKDIAEIIQARVDEAVKSAKAEATKSSTAGSMLDKGSANGADAKSDYQKYQESKKAQSTIVEL